MYLTLILQMCQKTAVFIKRDINSRKPKGSISFTDILHFDKSAKEHSKVTSTFSSYNLVPSQYIFSFRHFSLLHLGYKSTVVVIFVEEQREYTFCWGSRKKRLLGVVLINTWTAKLHFSANIIFNMGTMRANTIKPV